jgi:hypothetical protein
VLELQPRFSEGYLRVTTGVYGQVVLARYAVLAGKGGFFANVGENSFETLQGNLDADRRFDPNLTLTRTQHPATPRKVGKTKQLKHGGFANPCNIQKRPTAHS